MCGSRFGVTKVATASLSAGATLRAEAQAMYDRTGRIFGGDEQLIMVEHDAWSCLPSRKEIRDHRLAARLRDALRTVPPVSLPMTCFRGIDYLDPSVVATSKDCGAPPAEYATPYRFNPAKVPVLYLSESILGVNAELSARSRRRWLQRFVLPTTLTLGDLSALDRKHPANQAMFYAEMKNRDGDRDNEYLFSQVVAELLQEAFPGGIRVLGARDAPERYKNIVIFDHADWLSWVDGVPFIEVP